MILTRFPSYRWLQIIVLLFLLFGAVMLRLQDPPMISRLRHATFDYYNKLMPRPPSDDVVIIDIDEQSISKIGQWPWQRTLVADIPQRLKEMGARSVAFDIVFSEADRTSPRNTVNLLPSTPDMAPVVEKLKSLPDHDEVFAKAIADAGNVVTAFVAANQSTRDTPVNKAKIFNVGIKADPTKFVSVFRHYTTSLPQLTEAAAGNGSFVMKAENDGVIRRVPLLVGHLNKNREVAAVYPALSLEAIRVALDKKVYQVTSFGARGSHGYGIRDIVVGDYKIPTDGDGNIWVYYAGHRPHLYIPAWQLLAGHVDPEQIRDKIVLIGTSAIGLLDLRSTPINPVLPGVEVHAEIIEQILHGQFLQRPDYMNGAELVAMIFVCLLVIALAPFIGTVMLVLVSGTLVMLALTGSLYAYQETGWLIEPVYPSLVITAIFIASSIVSNLRTEMEKDAVRHAFGHYISPALMNELTSSPDKLKLGGETRELTVMFTDIRNFTGISEDMDPAELIKTMNDFLTPMTSCVQDNRGTVDKYMGDAIMAFWNAPLDDPDHARHACTSALDMLVALEDLNQVLEREAARKGRVFRPLRAGIGLHTGDCSVGNMGSKQRFAYSALGDTVNLASRLEGQTKQYGVPVIMSRDTRIAAPEYAAVELDLLAVRGRSEPEHIYALLGTEKMAQDDVFLAFARQHGKMVSAYRGREWNTAMRLAQECKSGNPVLAKVYDLYISRCMVYSQSPPVAGWQGVWVAQEK